MLKFKEILSEAATHKYKKGDKVVWAGTMGSRKKDKSGVITGFKDHEDYKNGYLVIKGSDGKEYKFIWTAVEKGK